MDSIHNFSGFVCFYLTNLVLSKMTSNSFPKSFIMHKLVVSKLKRRNIRALQTPLYLLLETAFFWHQSDNLFNFG